MTNSSCFTNPDSKRLHNIQSSNLPIDQSQCLTKYDSEANKRCADYVNTHFPATHETTDAKSDCGTISSNDYTNVNDERFSCRYRKFEDKRIISSIEIETLQQSQVSALIDTGATISVIDKKFLSEIENSVHSVKACSQFSIILSIENDSKFIVSSQAEICFKVNNFTLLWRFYIIEYLSNNLVLGMDFLAKYAVTIHCSPFRVEIKKPPTATKLPFSKATEYQVSLGSSKTTHNSNFSSKNPKNESSVNSDSIRSLPCLNSLLNRTARVHKRTVLPPMSYTAVQIFTSSGDGDVQLEPRREITESLNVLIGNCILTVKNNKTQVSVCNATNKPIVLNERTVLGKLHTLDANSIVGDMEQVCPQKEEILASIHNSHITNEESYPEFMNEIKLGTCLTLNEKTAMRQLIRRYADIFAHKTEPKGRTHLIEHNIELTENQPIRQRAYKQALIEKEKTRKAINDLLDQGIIQPSCSPWSSPVVLIKKKNGEIRFCVDYRKLNAVTKRDNYPLPRIDDALDRLNGAKFFSSMDCDQAYYQVPVAPDDIEKTAFITPDGLFEFKYMPFGLCNAPATFQRLMDVVLGRLKWTIALVYLDDIVVYAKSFEEHLSNLAQVFDALRRAGLKLKPSKCHFGNDKLLFLGHIISKDGVSVNPEKIKAVQNFPKPKCRRDVMSFVALCSYYRRFIRQFAKIARPLHDLTEKSAKFNWDNNCETAFQSLKNSPCTSQVLAYPDDNAPTQIHCDASGVGLGATLVQTQKGKERVVAYASRALKKHEKTYAVTELECAAVIYAVDCFRPHLYGKKFEIVTDHCSLCYLLKTKDPQGKLARWALKLQPYDFTIIYKSGKKHMDADSLSRNPVNVAPPSDQETLDFVELLCAVSINNSNTNIVQSQKNDPKLNAIYNAVTNQNPDLMPKKFKITDFTLKNNTLYKINNDEDGRLWRLCIPVQMRRKIMTEIHENTLGHLGLFKTWSLIKARFFWPRMYYHVRKFVNGCLQCQLHNKRTTLTPGPMQIMPPPATPFHRIGIDFQGPYPMTKNRNCYIFVAIDHLTRYIEAWPVTAPTAKVAIGVLEKFVIFNHGTPAEILCDRGSSFTSREFKSFAQKFHIKILFTTAYHPNTNGLCERANGTLKRILGKFVNETHRNWDKYVQKAVFAINIATHSVTQNSPF